MFALFQVFLIIMACCKMFQLRDPKNKSLNILNLWFLKTIVAALSIQLVLLLMDIGFGIAEEAGG